MKKRFLSYVAGVLACSLLIAGVAYGLAVTPFVDVDENYQYSNSIEYLHSLNILKGDDGQGTFRPEDNLNRAEFATIIVRLTGVEPSVDQYHDCFPDVKNEWFAASVCYAKELGFVKGYSAGALAGSYGPSASLLNAEIMVVMARMAVWELVTGGEWYTPAWNYAVNHKIVENQDVTAKTTRGLMAEVIFRTAVVGEYDLAVYTPEKGQEFIEMQGTVTPADMTLNISSTVLSNLTVDPDGGTTPLFKFSGMAEGEGSAHINSMALYFSDPDGASNLALLSMKNDQTGTIVFESDVKLMTLPSPFIIVFESPLVFEAGADSSYTLYADFDYETDVPVQLYMAGAADFYGDATINADFPLYGAEITRDPEFYDFGEDPEEMETCAIWEPEYNLPYPSEDESLDYESETPAGEAPVVAPPEAAHVIKPIDQGNRGICAAAAVYSSMRWLEELLGKDFIENGVNGLDALIDAFYNGVTTSEEQDEKMEEYLEGLNACIDVEVDTQAWWNVSCSDLFEYKDDCDIPLSFKCEKIDPATGEVITGAGAKTIRHRVDLTDVVIDPNNDDQCTITFANSWSDPATPGEDLDGLGGGRYERAVYNDDDESFDIEAPWGDRYKCALRAAVYICVDKESC